jgi:endogenous inhibitor of DNA gyrase (YacG/DUF329 family)
MSDTEHDSQTASPDSPTGRSCPICKKPAIVAYRPFCSRRCADVDLNRWFTGSYSVPAAPEIDESDDADEMEERRSE